MAIIFEFNVIVVRKMEIDAKYPGGLAHFRSQRLALPPDRWCEDEHLLAFSSMGSYLREVGDSLRAAGVDVLETNETEPPERIMLRCGWLERNVKSTVKRPMPKGSMTLSIVQYWLRGTEPGEVAQFARRRG